MKTLSGRTKEILDSFPQVIKFIVNIDELCNAFTSESQRFLVLGIFWIPYIPDFKDETPFG